MSSSRAGLWRSALAGLGLLVLLPSPARAQWYAGVSAGINHTPDADVTVNVPAQGLAATYHDVQFSAKPFKSPQYYVWRVGRFVGARRRVGIEFEFTHLKVIADTSRAYAASGQIGGATISGSPQLSMNSEVQEYQMTHGLNFLLGAIVIRQPIRGRVAFTARAGAGPTLPHAESMVLGVFRQQYQYAGVGVEAGAGLVVALGHGVGADVSYKLSRARPQIDVAGGTGRMTAITHQLAIGVVFGFGR